MSSLKERFLAMQRRERIMLSVLAAFLILALAYAAMTFLGGGGGGEPVTLPSTLPSVVVSPTPSPTTTTPPIAVGEFGGKDPFQPLVVVAPSGSPAPGGSPGASPTPGPSGGPSGGGTGGQSKRVVLRDVFRKGGHLWATVEVNGKDYTVQPGDMFANDFQLISLTSSCGDFAFGDSRFTLCIGQEVRK